jgi:hypothetical protein
MPCDRITRRNITTACNLCRRKKQRCNGGPVCSRCQEKKIKCDYPKPKKRGPPRNTEYFRPTIRNFLNNFYNNNEVEILNPSLNEVEGEGKRKRKILRLEKIYPNPVLT